MTSRYGTRLRTQPFLIALALVLAIIAILVGTHTVFAPSQAPIGAAVQAAVAK